MRLQNKIAIVTGAGSGFGRGIAQRFAAEGASVVVNDLNMKNGERTAEDIVAAGGAARFCGGDVAKDADVKHLVEFTLAAYGGLHVVVNNAGTTHKNQPMLDVSFRTFGRRGMACSSPSRRRRASGPGRDSPGTTAARARRS